MRSLTRSAGYLLGAAALILGPGTLVHWILGPAGLS